jgi:hypothetical protein
MHIMKKNVVNQNVVNQKKNVVNHYCLASFICDDASLSYSLYKSSREHEYGLLEVGGQPR